MHEKQQTFLFCEAQPVAGNKNTSSLVSCREQEQKCASFIPGQWGVLPEIERMRILKQMQLEIQSRAHQGESARSRVPDYGDDLGV